MCFRAAAPRSLPYHAGVYTRSVPEARTWALLLSYRLLARAVEQTVCDRHGSLVGMMRSPWVKDLTAVRFGHTGVAEEHGVVSQSVVCEAGRRQRLTIQGTVTYPIA